MTRRESERRARQAQILLNLGFTTDEAETLRRASVTLQRWHEAKCGTDHTCLVRGRWQRDAGAFEYDDDGAPYWEHAGASGRWRYTRTPDRERGARRRIADILGQRNGRPCLIDGTCYAADPRGAITAYIQTDPRGAALYLLRPGDVPAGGDVGSYYNRGICVC